MFHYFCAVITVPIHYTVYDSLKAAWSDNKKLTWIQILDDIVDMFKFFKEI